MHLPGPGRFPCKTSILDADDDAAPVLEKVGPVGLHQVVGLELLYTGMVN
jgi:hypothetical protein